MTTTMDPIMFWATMAQWAICSAGFVMNGFLVYTILRNKNLRTSCCSIFILILAICDCFAELSLITVPPVLAIADTQIQMLTCFLLISYGPFSQMSLLVILFLISLDRLISILFPIWYKWFSHCHKWKYMIMFVICPALLAASLMLFTAFQYTIDNAKKPVFCQPTDFMSATTIFFGSFASLWLNIGTFAVYLAIWMLIKCQVIKITQEKSDRRLFRSLFVLMLITFFFWMPFPFAQVVILPNIQISANALNIASRIAQQFNKFAQTLNGPVLYFCSSDYRKAMRKELLKIFWHKKDQQTPCEQQLHQQTNTIQINNFVHHTR